MTDEEKQQKKTGWSRGSNGGGKYLARLPPTPTTLISLAYHGVDRWPVRVSVVLWFCVTSREIPAINSVVIVNL